LSILKKFFVLVLLLAVVAAASMFYAVRWLEQWAATPMLQTETVVLQIPQGSSLYRLSMDLERKGLITQGRFLRWYIKFNKMRDLIQAGEYEVPVGMTPIELIARIQSGQVVQYSVTLINGQTYKEFLKTLAADPVLVQRLPGMSPDEILQALGEQRSNPEGLFYPDTYHFHRGDSDLAILQRAHQRMGTLLQKAWEGRAEELPYETPYQALIMASIVEKETGVAAERPLIAGVFVNRLKLKMRLQTDPTVIYGLGDDYKGNITRAHLQQYTPYNTYRIEGLPPTPIANPALPAIEAALHPAETKALYFVAKGDGSHYFSTTLEEHVNAVRKYQFQRRSDYRSSPQ